MAAFSVVKGFVVLLRRCCYSVMSLLRTTFWGVVTSDTVPFGGGPSLIARGAVWGSSGGHWKGRRPFKPPSVVRSANPTATSFFCPASSPPPQPSGRVTAPGLNGSGSRGIKNLSILFRALCRNSAETLESASGLAPGAFAFVFLPHHIQLPPAILARPRPGWSRGAPAPCPRSEAVGRTEMATAGRRAAHL